MHLHEQIQYDHPLLSMKIFNVQRKAGSHIGPWHYHREHEFLAVLEGSMELHLENETYTLRTGEVMLIGSSQLHRDRFFPDRSVEYLVMQTDLFQYFDPGTISYLQAFTESRRPLSQLNYIFQTNPSAKQAVFEAIRDIYEESNAKALGYELAVSMRIKQIVLTLIRSDVRGLLDLHADANLMRLRPVLEYVDRHLDDRLIVEESCKLVNMSYYYFVKFFKKTVGISFTDYVHFKRIKKAEMLLLTRDLSIADIGERIGMQNMSHFYKMFKKINGCSPNEFRKKMTAANFPSK